MNKLLFLIIPIFVVIGIGAYAGFFGANVLSEMATDTLTTPWTTNFTDISGTDFTHSVNGTHTASTGSAGTLIWIPAVPDKPNLSIRIVGFNYSSGVRHGFAIAYSTQNNTNDANTKFAISDTDSDSDYEIYHAATAGNLAQMNAYGNTLYNITVIQNDTTGPGIWWYFYVNEEIKGEVADTAFSGARTGRIRGIIIGGYAGENRAKEFGFTDLIVYENFSLIPNQPPVPPDTTPPEITMINLTSDSVEELVWRSTYSTNYKVVSPYNQTNDTTPTIRVNTDEDSTCAILNHGLALNYSDATTYNGASECATTGAKHHVCTLTDDNATTIGLFNFSVGCKDGATPANENLTATTGNFTINITDPGSVNASVLLPANGSVFRVGVNFTLGNQIQLNITATDQFDQILRNVSLILNGDMNSNKTGFPNGTVHLFNITINSVGDYNWSVNATDLSSNKNNSQFHVFTILEEQFNVIANITLNNSYANRSYEYNTTLINETYGVLINITMSPQANWSLDNDYLINWTTGEGNTTIFINITELNTTEFNGSRKVNISAGTFNVTIKSDNQTDLKRFALVVRGYETTLFPRDAFIDIDSDGNNDFVLIGLITNNFLHATQFKSTQGNASAQNLTFIRAGAKVLIINTTTDLDVVNFTMQLSGYDLDSANEFTYQEGFNLTSKVYHNLTLSTHVLSPGTYEDFITNRSNWNITPSGTITEEFGYVTSPFSAIRFSREQAPGEGEITLKNIDVAMDLRNTSFMSVLYGLELTCTGQGPDTGDQAEFWLDITDGTSIVNLVHNLTLCSPGSGVKNATVYANHTLVRVTDTSYELYFNKSLQTTVSFSGLNPDNRWSIQFRNAHARPQSQTPETITLIDKILWGGLWLNNTNGTFNTIGNFTSTVINYTKDNVSKATLTCFDIQPDNTTIKYYLSNTGNYTRPRFYEVTLGEVFTFPDVGSALLWGAALNTTYANLSPVVDKCDITVVPSQFENISVDCGADGDVDWSFLGTEFDSSTSPKVANCSASEFSDYKFANCVGQPNCEYPVSIALGEGGVPSIDNVNLTFALGELEMTNLSLLEDKTNPNITVVNNNGLLELSNLDLEFVGSKNITLFLHTYVNATHLLGTNNLTMLVYHSKLNRTLAGGQSNYNVFFSSRNDKNATPFAQTDVTPIWNMTNKGYELPMDLYVSFPNVSQLTACANATYSNNSNRSQGDTTFIVVNHSQRILYNVSKQPYQLEEFNQSINLTMNNTDDNSTKLRKDIVDEQFLVRNDTDPFALLNRNSDYRINFSTGNFSLTNSTYNITGLFISYNYSIVTPSKGIWNWWDLSGCGRRFLIPDVDFIPYCINCVR